MNNLAYMYENACGVEKDIDKALYYYYKYFIYFAWKNTRAALKGYVAAMTSLARIYETGNAHIK